MIDEIDVKYKDIIDIAKKYMISIKDNEHNINHVEDVINYTKELLGLINKDIDKEVCIVSVYWHDVGRIKLSTGHEKLSAEMLKEELEKRDFDIEFINKCYKAIENHKWDMVPETIEGLIIKDADKLAWLGSGRWKSCLDSGQDLDSIIELLPKLRNDILYFEESRKIYDRDIVKLVNTLYRRIYDWDKVSNRK